MTGFGSRLLDRAFGRPRGALGRLGGALMTRGNARTELQVVRLAGLRAYDHVLVVGAGPGVGLRAAGEQAGRVVGLDPSAVMREAAARRCADLVRAGRVELRGGTAERIGLPDRSADVVLSVNNVQLWPDRRAGLAELHRVLREDGRLVISVHERLLAGGRASLEQDVRAAGFEEVQSWSWATGSHLAGSAAQLRAHRPAARPARPG